MKKILLRAAPGLLVVAVAAVLVAWWLVAASLPELDGELALNGPKQRLTIARDAEGIVTVTAESRDDLAYGLGFAHGQDRFFQMDLVRRQAGGELAELFGEAAIGVDKRHRFHAFRQRAREVLAQATANERQLLDRYADGVNAGLASLGARPFEYLLLRAEPRAWQAEDTVLVVYAMFMQLNDSRARRDVRRGLAKRVLPPAVYEWLYPVGTPWDAPLMGEPRDVLPYPQPDEYSVREWSLTSPVAGEYGGPPLDGSNNWAVAGALTLSGRALVSNDMHLGHAIPNIWYQARLVLDGASRLDVAGVTLPGAPFVVAGSNGSIAWGFTNSYGDWSDAVRIVPGEAPNTYRSPDGDRPFTVREERIRVRGEPAPAVYRVRETIWGPVDDAQPDPEGEIAVRWIAHEARAVNLKLLHLQTATSVDEALDIANRMGIPAQNFVVGDAGGNIAWTIAGLIPVREGYDPMAPADWSGGAGWTRWREPGEHPRVVNPPGGRIWTANARVADGEALAIIGDSGYDLAARSRQIRDGLRAKDQFTPEDMLAIQYDDRAIFLMRWRDLLLDVLDDAVVAGDPQLAEYRRLVLEWVPRAVPESVGYRLVRGFRLEVRQRVFHGLMAPVYERYGADADLLISNQFEAPLWQLVTERPLHLLSGRYPDWQALLLESVRANLDHLQTHYGEPLSERSWGEYNTARIQHPLSRALPALSGWLDMPAVPLNGDMNLPKAQGRSFGASERFSVSPGDEANGLMHMPVGQSGHPLSPYYAAGHEDWLLGRPSPFLPGETVHRLTLTPAEGKIDSP